MRERISMYRWMFLVLPAYSAFAFGPDGWPLAAAVAVAIVAYNLTMSRAERRWPEWVRSRTVFLRCVEIGLACIALSLIYLKGQNARFLDFYYDGFYALPVILAAGAAGRRGLLWSVVAATLGVVFGQLVLTPQPDGIWSLAATEYWLSLGGYSAIYAVFFATVGGLSLSVREYESRRQRDLMLKLAASFGELREPVLLTDAAGRVMSLNRAAEALLGHRLTRTFARPIAEICPGIGIGETHELVDGRTRPRELSIRRSDGREVLCDVTVSPYLVAGETAAYVVMARDASSRLEIECRLAEQERLLELGGAIDGVASNVLMQVRGIGELVGVLLLDERPSYETRGLAMIRESAARLGDTLENLLHFRRRAGDSRPAVELNALVDHALRLRLPAPRSQVEIRCDFTDPSPRVLGNAAQLEQVVLSLITNAVEAVTSQGRGCVSIRTRLQGGDRAVLEVEDTGPGIPDDFIDRIFEPYVTTKAPGEGIGLGLTIARAILSDHGGELTVWSEPGRGARFTLMLPAVARRRSPPISAVEPRVEAVRRAVTRLAGVETG